MFLNIEISNFQGIENKIQIDFKAIVKKRESKKIYITPDGIKVNKIIGIIGCNASGKSSIINAIMYAEDFISKDTNLEEKKEKFLIAQNTSEKDTEIKIEFYIPNGDNPGYYVYHLRYSSKGVHEKLMYKSRYIHDWKEIINIENKLFISDINFRWKYYRNIIAHQNNSEIKLIEEVKMCDSFYEFFIMNNIFIESNYDLEFLNRGVVGNNKSSLKSIAQICNMIDPSIKECTIENGKIYFYNVKNKRLTIDEISRGTRKFVDYVIAIKYILYEKGSFIVDELENYFYSDIIEYIYKYFSIDLPVQLIFTTNNKYIFDLKDKNQERYIDNDQICVLTKKISSINVEKNNVRYDKIFSKAYKLCDVNEFENFNELLSYNIIKKIEE